MALETENPNEKQHLTDNSKHANKSAENEISKKKGTFE